MNVDVGFDRFGAQPVLRVDQSNLDDFERDLLPLLRHFLTDWFAPETHNWHVAYVTAAERWGQSVGLAIAHALFDVVRTVATVKNDAIFFHDPLNIETRQVMTMHEMQILSVLHHMRRDHTSAARMMIERLTDGTMDPYLIRAGLQFAARFSVGAGERPNCTRPVFKVVH